jgi:4-diphosphocytidyl-2-C-methyl-D-erythritol kinase
VQDNKKFDDTTNFNEKMIVFPNCKINLGLQVTEKRKDGFHNLSTVFYPINWCDSLELVSASHNSTNFSLSLSGIPINGELKDNLLHKTYHLINATHSLPDIDAHLHKLLPMGAGLGGGSANAVFLMDAIIKLAQLDITQHQRLQWATQLGSDCAFFVKNTPQYAQGRGELLQDCTCDLSKYAILVIYPNIHSNTKEAFQGLQPKPASFDLKTIIETYPIEQWKNYVHNDFEVTIFKKYPEIERLKNKLYQCGAIYASLSGSGSAIYGIFDKVKEIELPKEYRFNWQKEIRN